MTIGNVSRGDAVDAEESPHGKEVRTLQRNPKRRSGNQQIAVAVVEHEGKFLVGFERRERPLAGIFGISWRKDSARRNAGRSGRARMPRRDGPRCHRWEPSDRRARLSAWQV